MIEISELLKAHKLGIGLAADGLTFGGGLLLARDAFRHLVDLRKEQLEKAFRERFRRIGAKLADTKEAEAREAMRFAWRGLALLCLGFICQIMSRFTE